MEKKVYELKIDPEFEELIAKPSEAEQTVLCESLDKYGCLDELTVWHGFILDGHTRYRHCVERGIPFSYREMDFSSREEAKLWILELSLGRRSLTKYQRTKLALRYEAVWKEDAEKRMKEGKNPVHYGAQGSEKGRTRDKIAAMAGVSHKYVDQVKHLEAEADEETKKKLERDEISVNKAINDLKAKVAPVEQPEKKAEEAAMEGIGETTDEKKPVEKIMKSVTVEGQKLVGMADDDGFVHHTGKVEFTDTEEGQEAIRFELETALSNFDATIQDCLDRLEGDLATKEFCEELLGMLRSETKSTITYASRKLREVVSE